MNGEDAMKQDEGKQFQEAHQKKVNDQIEEQLGSKLNSLKETWTKVGYNKEEIDLLEEAFAMTTIKDKETYRADRKAAKKIYRKVQESLEKRLNSGDNS